MCLSHIIQFAYDYTLPETDFKKMRDGIIGYTDGFALEIGHESYRYFSTYKVYDKICKNHKYIYEIWLKADERSLENLRNYLIKNMKSESTIEIQSIWETGNYLGYCNEKIPTKNVPIHELDDVEDDIDYYYTWIKEINPELKNTFIRDLTIDDISFVLDNMNVCLIIKRFKE